MAGTMEAAVRNRVTTKTHPSNVSYIINPIAPFVILFIRSSGRVESIPFNSIPDQSINKITSYNRPIRLDLINFK